MQGQNAAILGGKKVPWKVPFSVSLIRLTHCVTAVSLRAPQSEGRCVVVLQHGQVSIKASADVLPSSGEHRKFHSDSDCNAANKKKEGLNQHFWGRAHNK